MTDRALREPRLVRLGRILSLAATPVFAGMALLTALLEGDGAPPLCSVGRDLSPMAGMVPMYLLMSVVHAPPWLRLIARRAARAAA